MVAVAAIDCGTNSIKLLIADFPRVLVRTSEVVRLGEGVDRTGRLAPAALERTFAALDRFVAIIAEHRVPADRIRFCATSATRDAANSTDFTDGVRQRLGIEPEVLPGSAEAALGFAGATMFADPRPVDPVLVVDIGGGSTELVLGDVSTGPRQALSMDIGSVRLTERELVLDPPSPAQIARALAEIDTELDVAEQVYGVDIASAATVIGTSGTVKTIAAAMMQLPTFDREALDGAELSITDAIEYCAQLAAMTVAERLAIPSMHPGRADVIGAGALIWSRVLARSTTETFTVSEADLLYGIAAEIPA